MPRWNAEFLDIGFNNVHVAVGPRRDSAEHPTRSVDDPSDRRAALDVNVARDAVNLGLFQFGVQRSAYGWNSGKSFEHAARTIKVLLHDAGVALAQRSLILEDLRLDVGARLDDENEGAKCRHAHRGQHEQDDLALDAHTYVSAVRASRCRGGAHFRLQ